MSSSMYRSIIYIGLKTNMREKADEVNGSRTFETNDEISRWIRNGSWTKNI
jgi:hypothetical protein